MTLLLRTNISNSPVPQTYGSDLPSQNVNRMQNKLYSLRLQHPDVMDRKPRPGRLHALFQGTQLVTCRARIHSTHSFIHSLIHLANTHGASRTHSEQATVTTTGVYRSAEARFHTPRVLPVTRGPASLHRWALSAELCLCAEWVASCQTEVGSRVLPYFKVKPSPSVRKNSLCKSCG